MSNDSPHIDIVMPHYEISDFLADALASIVAQSYTNWTLHFVDDCSPNDDWHECLHQYQAEPRVRCYQTDRNVGTYRVKNAMLPKLTGPLVSFHDADDMSDVDRFSRQVRTLHRRRIDVLGSSYVHISPTGEITKKRKMRRNVNFWLARGKGSVLYPPTLLTKLDLMNQLNGFDGTTRISADSDFVLRASHFFKIRNMRKALYLRRKHPRALTATPETGFKSPKRKSYQQAMFARYKSRLLMKGEELKEASLAPDNDVEFRVTELW